MRALRLIEFGRPLAAAPVDEPDPRPGEVLVRVRACGICHSDAHYRSGVSNIVLPRTPGHEVAGVVERCPGNELAVGANVALHYLVACGRCDRCLGPGEQFCREARMLGKDRDGGYAEYVVVPVANAVPVPDGVPLEHAAVMMCSTATAYHALRLAETSPGDVVAVIGFGGLGVSALQLARTLGASRVAALDVVPEKLARAAAMGAVPIDAASSNAGAETRSFAGAHGIDVALDFSGQPATAARVLSELAPHGRLVMVALSRTPPPFDPYRDLVGKEARIVGCSDHLLTELPALLELACCGRIDMAAAVSATVPLEAGPVNATLDALEHGSAKLRTVILP